MLGVFWKHFFRVCFGVLISEACLSWGVCRVNIIPTGHSALDLAVLGGVSSGRVTAARLMLAPSHWAISSDLNRRDSVPMCAGGWEIGMVLPSTFEPK